MPAEILATATGLLDPDELRVDSLLQDIRRRRDEAEEALLRVQTSEEEALSLRRAAERELREAERVRLDARGEALAQAEAELEEARTSLRQLQRDRETLQIAREQVEERRKDVDRAALKIRQVRRERTGTAASTAAQPTIAAGDRVRVIPLDQEGEVISAGGGYADVMMGVLKTRQPLMALQRLGRARTTESQRPVVVPAAREPVNLEIDLRGYRAAEVEAMLDGYLEAAYRSGLPFVRIIHGKGTGALRKVVRDLLANHPAVASYDAAPANQGGDGATVAVLRVD